MSRLHLSFETNSMGATILRVKQQQPPWRVIRGFKAPSGQLISHVNNVSGGILDTDSLDWRIEVAPGAQAQVPSTGATRVYRSRARDRVASQRAALTIAENAYLEYLPDQLIPFAGSRFDQSMRVELARGASLILWDRIAPGRERSREPFRSQSRTSAFELVAGSEPIAIERWPLAPLLRRVGALPTLAPLRYFCS